MAKKTVYRASNSTLNQGQRVFVAMGGILRHGTFVAYLPKTTPGMFPEVRVTVDEFNGEECTVSAHGVWANTGK